MKNDKCPICGKKKVDRLGKISEYVFCKNCHTAWRKTFPKTEYGASYYSGKSGIAAKLFSPLAYIFHRIRESYVGFGEKKLWIDVGAGEGNFLKTVGARRRLGVEVSASGRKLMQEKRLETRSEKEFLRARGLGADVISFWHVLEHVDNPHGYLAAARANLSPGGRIVIGVPNVDSLDFRVFGRNWFHLAPQYHLWHFSPKSLEILLKKAGFKIEKIDWWSPEHHPAGILQSFINSTSGSRNALHALVRRGEGSSFSAKDAFWSIFWLTVGLPIIFSLWTASSLFHRSGAIVVVAK